MSSSTSQKGQDDVDSLASQIKALSVTNDPLSSQDFKLLIDAFRPFSSSATGQAKSISLLTLAKLCSSSSTGDTTISSKEVASQSGSQLSTLFLPLIRSRLAETDTESLVGALRFLAALFVISPSDAHPILISSDGVLELVLDADSSCQDQSASATTPSHLPTLSGASLVTLSISELIGSAANHKPCRNALVNNVAAQEWLETVLIKNQASQNVTLRNVAITAAVARLKLDRAASQSDPSASSGIEDLAKAATNREQHLAKFRQQRQKRRKQDGQLFALIQTQLVALDALQQAQAHSQSQSQPHQQPNQQDRKLATQTCLEGLTYLSISPLIKQAICDDGKLVKALLATCSFTSNQRKSVFPVRTSSKEDKPNVAQASSSYEVDPAATGHSDTTTRFDLDSDRYDTALQYGLASTLANLVAYRPIMTDEERQMQKLKKLANAQATTNDDPQDQKEDRLRDPQHVERRCDVLIEAGIVPVLVSLAQAAPPVYASTRPGDVVRYNPSAAVRSQLSKALLSLTTRQSKLVRGKLVRQGAVRALLSLCSALRLDSVSSTSTSSSPSPTNPFLPFPATSSSTTIPEESFFYPIQSLIQILISINPALIFASPAECQSLLPLVISVYLHPNSSRLQKFEATLALTNLASLDDSLANSIATATLPELYSPSSSSSSSNPTPIMLDLPSRILLEDNSLTQTANLELFCNLISSEKPFTLFVSSCSNSTISTFLHLLLALSQPTTDDSRLKLVTTAILSQLTISNKICHLVFLLDFSIFSSLLPNLLCFNSQEFGMVLRTVSFFHHLIESIQDQEETLSFELERLKQIQIDQVFDNLIQVVDFKENDQAKNEVMSVVDLLYRLGFKNLSSSSSSALVK